MIGVIALDIDGTAAVEGQQVSSDVARYLDEKAKEGWKIIFLTGRPFDLGIYALQKLDFPYIFGAQNGAIALEMPSQKVLMRNYLNKDIFSAMEAICAEEPTDFVVYTGMEHGGICYYRPQYFEDRVLDYVERRAKHYGENWQAVSSFDIQTFPSVKCIGNNESTKRISERIEREIGLNAPQIKDIFEKDYYVTQATLSTVNKGKILETLTKGCSGPVIVAGDDYNDKSMLAVADVKIVMATAPEELRREADIVAPPAREKGIITGLEEAIRA